MSEKTDTTAPAPAPTTTTEPITSTAPTTTATAEAPQPAAAPTTTTTAEAPQPAAAPTTTTTAEAPQPAAAPTTTTTAEAPQPTTAPTTTATAEAPQPTTAPTTTATADAPQPTTAPTTTATADAPQPATAPVAPTANVTEVTTEKNEPEPQNPLTEIFTTEEWTALKEFRDLLPEIFAEAFPDDPKAKETPTTIWGVTINPSNPRNAKASVVLMKFLRARNLNVSQARDMFQSTLRWRKSFNIESALEEKFPEDLFGAMGYVYGKDKEGRPVMYNVYGGNKDLKAVFADVDLFLRWRIAMQERAMRQLDFETIDQTLQIHDYAGVSLTSRDANSKNAAQQATSIFLNHYPELLFKKFFINVPTLLNWIFWAFKPLIPVSTLIKMSVVGTGSHAIHKALGPYISDDELPKRYGGKADGF